MFMSDQFRIISQYINNNYVPQAGQTGIRIEAGMTSSVFVANHRNLEIRGFDIGIWAQGDEAMINGVLVVNGVNEWSIHGWLLDNRIAVRLHHCSTWNLDALSIETSVIGARAYQLFKSVANILITGGRWELNAANSFGIEGDGTVYGGNIRVRGVNLGISGDNGSTIPGRKWTGVLPGDTVFEGSDVNGPFVVVPGQIAVRLPNSLKIGGQNLGNGKVFLASNSGTAASTIEQNGTNFSIASTNSVKVYGNSATNERLEVTGSRVIFAGVDGPSGHVGALRLVVCASRLERPPRTRTVSS
jgi:hypothetical protein